MKQIFINLAVNDVEKSMRFYAQLGFTNNPQFSDDGSKCMVWSDTISVMIMGHEKFQGFAHKPIADTKNNLAALFALPVDNLAEVNHILEAGLKAGGTEPVPMSDYGFMQLRKIEDFDGHVWEIYCMDINKFPKQEIKFAREQDKEKIIIINGGATPFVQTYFHGTKADLKMGDFIEAGFNSNYGQRKAAKYIFLSSTLDAAIWGAELAFGDGRERIYLVEPTGEIENDPDLTDQKFPGNPSMSYRSVYPFRVIGEVTIWQGHLSEQVKGMKEHLDKLKEQGLTSLND